MTTTILAVIALTGPLASAAKPEFQAQTDYGQAMKLAANEKKPIAVLIGKGDAFAKLMGDAALTAEAKKLLAEKYVCVSVNVDTEAGKKLADQFDLKSGLVISSAGGSYQALRQAGTVSATDLAKHAGTYANATGNPATTVTVGAPAVAAPVYYRGQVLGGCPGGNCPGSTIIPTGYTYPAAPFYGSSCPGGNCPNSIIPTGGYIYPSYGSSCPNGRCPGSTPTIIRR